MANLAALQEFKAKIDVEIENYFDRVIKETEKIDKDISGALKHSKKIILSGGKRARGAFMYYGYLAAGGTELKRMLKTSVSIELVHLFLLVHDDIIDQDSKRHGVITTHEYYKKIGKNFLRNKNPEHFGVSMGIIVGDMLGAMGNQIIFESGFNSDLVIKALTKLQKIISMTVIGESEDVHIENRGKATVDEILRMYEHKTAKYTFEGPLHLGAILGGKDNKKFLEHLSGYAIPAGIAFQIQDDILGVFGSEKKTGKPAGSDIRQGKYTILVAKAYERADKAQKKALEGILGKPEISKGEIEIFQQIIKDTGSYDYAKKLSKELVLKAKRELSKLRIKPEAGDFLNDIADYMIEREL
ncbi:MAG TPA: hypothetical protein DIT25_04190 [Candidatus Moranbacteria bacterium]|nr:hypothetical protein [Candidatus Moranbacteria bacterium]